MDPALSNKIHLSHDKFSFDPCPRASHSDEAPILQVPKPRSSRGKRNWIKLTLRRGSWSTGASSASNKPPVWEVFNGVRSRRQYSESYDHKPTTNISDKVTPREILPGDSLIGCIPRQPRLKNSFGDFLHTLRGKKEKDVARHVALEGLFPRSEPKECSDSDHEVAELPTLQDGITYKNAHPSTVRGVGKGCSALFDPQGPRKIHIIDALSNDPTTDKKRSIYQRDSIGQPDLNIDKRTLAQSSSEFPEITTLNDDLCTTTDDNRPGTPDSYLLMLIEASDGQLSKRKGSTSSSTSHNLQSGFLRSISAVRRHSVRQLPSVIRSHLHKIRHPHKNPNSPKVSAGREAYWGPPIVHRLTATSVSILPTGSFNPDDHHRPHLAQGSNPVQTKGGARQRSKVATLEGDTGRLQDYHGTKELFPEYRNRSSARSARYLEVIEEPYSERFDREISLTAAKMTENRHASPVSKGSVSGFASSDFIANEGEFWSSIQIGRDLLCEVAQPETFKKIPSNFEQRNKTSWLERITEDPSLVWEEASNLGFTEPMSEGRSSIMKSLETFGQKQKYESSDSPAEVPSNLTWKDRMLVDHAQPKTAHRDFKRRSIPSEDKIRPSSSILSSELRETSLYTSKSQSLVRILPYPLFVITDMNDSAIIDKFPTCLANTPPPSRASSPNCHKQNVHIIDRTSFARLPPPTPNSVRWLESNFYTLPCGCCDLVTEQSAGERSSFSSKSSSTSIDEFAPAILENWDAGELSDEHTSKALENMDSASRNLILQGSSMKQWCILADLQPESARRAPTWMELGKQYRVKKDGDERTNESAVDDREPRYEGWHGNEYDIKTCNLGKEEQKAITAEQQEQQLLTPRKLTRLWEMMGGQDSWNSTSASLSGMGSGTGGNNEDIKSEDGGFERLIYPPTTRQDQQSAFSSHSQVDPYISSSLSEDTDSVVHMNEWVPHVSVPPNSREATPEYERHRHSRVDNEREGEIFPYIHLSSESRSSFSYMVDRAIPSRRKGYAFGSPTFAENNTKFELVFTESENKVKTLVKKSKENGPLRIVKGASNSKAYSKLEGESLSTPTPGDRPTTPTKRVGDLISLFQGHGMMPHIPKSNLIGSPPRSPSTNENFGQPHHSTFFPSSSQELNKEVKPSSPKSLHWGSWSPSSDDDTDLSSTFGVELRRVDHVKFVPVDMELHEARVE